MVLDGQMLQPRQHAADAGAMADLLQQLLDECSVRQADAEDEAPGPGTSGPDDRLIPQHLAAAKEGTGSGVIAAADALGPCLPVLLQQEEAAGAMGLLLLQTGQHFIGAFSIHEHRYFKTKGIPMLIDLHPHAVLAPEKSVHLARLKRIIRNQGVS